MINKRLFTFGCSYTEYSYPTWADILGSTFSFYKNYGRGGASNYYIMSKFIESNQKHNFTSGDVVYVMFTGFSRFTYLRKELSKSVRDDGEYYWHGDWVTNGEIENYFRSTKDETTGKLLDSVWTTDLGIYMSYIAISTVRAILEKSGAEFRLMLAIDNRDFVNNPKTYSLADDSIEAAKKFYELLDIKYSMDEWRDDNYDQSDRVVWDGAWEEVNCPSKRIDGHPTIKMHYDYIKKYFPHLVNERTDNFVNTEINLLNSASQQQQGLEYSRRLLTLHNFKDRTFYNWV